MSRDTRLHTASWPLVIVAVSVLSLAAQPKPTFEVASIKRRVAAPGPPSGLATRTGGGVFYRRSETVSRLVQFAYDVTQPQVVGGPEWVRRDGFEINARAGNVPLDRIRLMVQSLLEERFTLVVRKEQREMTVSALVLARADGRLGPKLERCGDPVNPEPPKPVRVPAAGWADRGACVTMSAIANLAIGRLGGPVVDKTGLTGTWTYEIAYALPEMSPPPGSRLQELAERENVPPFGIALQEQLGLKAEPPARTRVDVVIIESVERPTEN
jgi:uncharacterized protein (TIGR03435 family)